MDSFCPNSQQLFDAVRGCFVAHTPEEQVRQSVLVKMMRELHYPKEFIAVEKELKELPHLFATATPPQRRIDILCYGKNIHPRFSLYPLVLIECKCAEIDSKAREQVIGYNAYVQACYIALAGREEEQFGFFDKKAQRYVFYPGLPSYTDLIAWLKL
ncbi:MAG TPA: type I restriction enzyme HsdR N-terminal domain-containing protein [Rhabdochlamydiaceae bacterium]